MCEDGGFDAVGAFDGWQARACLASLRKRADPIALLVHLDLWAFEALEPRPNEPVILLLNQAVARPPALARWTFHDVIVGPPSLPCLRSSLARLRF